MLRWAACCCASLACLRAAAAPGLPLLPWPAPASKGCSTSWTHILWNSCSVRAACWLVLQLAGLKARQSVPVLGSSCSSAAGPASAWGMAGGSWKGLPLRVGATQVAAPCCCASLSSSSAACSAVPVFTAA